jgi:hypothetical protein
MVAYTDYPLGQPPRQVVRVTVLAYDRNKYATVVFDGEPHEVKRGYLFDDQAMTRRLRDSKLYGLPAAADGVVPSRKQVAAELREKRYHLTDYTVWVGDKRHPAKSLRSALRVFATNFRRTNCSITRYRAYGGGSIHEGLIDSEAGVITLISSRNGRSIIKARRVNRL